MQYLFEINKLNKRKSLLQERKTRDIKKYDVEIASINAEISDKLTQNGIVVCNATKTNHVGGSKNSKYNYNQIDCLVEQSSGNMTTNELAKKTGIPYFSVYNYLNRHTNKFSRSENKAWFKI